MRGGIGIFHDFFPATVADSFLNNSPLYNQFFVGPGAISPGATGNILDQAAGANAAFTSAFASGGTLNSISQASPFFVPPALFNSAGNIHAPQYQEWNLQVQQGFGEKTSVSINYVGNHQIYGPIQNGGLNAYCNVAPITPPNPTVPAATPCAADLLNTVGFVGLPLTPADPRFGTITEISSSNVGNYNGVTLSLQRRFSSLQFQANYTYSHALTMISNGGFLPFNFNTNESTANPQDPNNFRKYNYGNADYDVRHSASLNYVWTIPKLSGWRGAIASWTVSGTLFWRTGLPVTAYDDNGSGVLSGFNYAITNGDPLFANYLGSGPVLCTRAAILPVSGAGSPCLTAGQQFTGLQSPDPTTPITTFGNQRSNQI